MDIEVVEDKKNELLKRREVRFKAYYEGVTPSRQQIREKIIKDLKADPKLTVLDNITAEYGKTEARGYAKIYDDDQAMKIEAKYKVDRNTVPPAQQEKKPQAKEDKDDSKQGETKKPEETSDSEETGQDEKADQEDKKPPKGKEGEA